jgi:voltage-gated potassium channel
VVTHPLRRFRLPGLLLAVVLVVGTGGYVLIGGWTLLDAFYMTIITISTVGFTEVHPLAPAGKLFTSALIVGGVGTMLYGFGVFAEMLSEGRLGEYRRQRNMARQVSALREHFIICGYGRIGTQIVTEFEHARASYIVIDNNPEALRRLSHEDRLFIEGDAASEEVLKEAGIERARGLVCAVDADERAVYISLAARALNPDLYILARAGQPESIRRLELAGANRVISPYRMAGHQLAELALRPALLDVTSALHHGDGDVGVEELLVSATCGQVGKTLAGSGLQEPAVARLLALRRRSGDLHVNPGGEMVLEEGDLIIAIGSQQQLEATAALLQ